MGQSEAAKSDRILVIQPQRLLEESSRIPETHHRPGSVKHGPTPEGEVEGVHVVRPLALSTPASRLKEFDADRSREHRGDLILKLEDIRPRLVKPVCPKVSATFGINQLGVRGEDHAQRIRFVVQRGRPGRARGAAPQLHDLKLLFSVATARDIAAAAVRAGFRLFAGEWNTSNEWDRWRHREDEGYGHRITQLTEIEAESTAVGGVVHHGFWRRGGARSAELCEILVMCLLQCTRE